MSAISKEGYEQIKIIKNALDSMYDKLDQTMYTKVKPTKTKVLLTVLSQNSWPAGFFLTKGFLKLKL